MQMLLVARSRRMCARASEGHAARLARGVDGHADDAAGSPARARPCAKNAACGPPYPSGTPKRWLDPTATSAPNSRRHEQRELKRSAATTNSAPTPGLSPKGRGHARRPACPGSSPRRRRCPRQGRRRSRRTEPSASRVVTTSITAGGSRRRRRRCAARPSASPRARVHGLGDGRGLSSSEAFATGRPGGPPPSSGSYARGGPGRSRPGTACTACTSRGSRAFRRMTGGVRVSAPAERRTLHDVLRGESSGAAEQPASESAAGRSSARPSRMACRTVSSMTRRATVRRPSRACAHVGLPRTDVDELIGVAKRDGIGAPGRWAPETRARELACAGPRRQEGRRRGGIRVRSEAA